MQRYHDRVEPAVASAVEGLERLEATERDVRREVGVPDKRNQLVNAIHSVDYREILASVDVELPDPDSPGVDDPLLDTRRSLMQQLDAYKQYDMRYQ